MSLNPYSPIPLSHQTSYFNPNEQFAREIKKDEYLWFRVDLMIKALPLQLQRIDTLYLYEDLEKGDIFENLSDRQVVLSSNEVMELLKILAKHSFYREDARRFGKHDTNRKIQKIRDVCFTEVIDDFEKKIKQCNLNQEHQWCVLAHQIFKDHILIKQ